MTRMSMNVSVGNIQTPALGPDQTSTLYIDRTNLGIKKFRPSENEKNAYRFTHTVVTGETPLTSGM